MKQFTTEQARAISSRSLEILVVAGPGSGKTATTVERIKSLVELGADPRRMVAITFTNAGARELEKRLTFEAHENGDESMPPIKVAHRLGYCGTLHGFCLRMLKQHGTALGYGERIALIDAEASADLIQSKATSLGCRTPLKKLLALKSELGGRLSRGKSALDDIVIAGYYDDMREAGLVDFDLLLTEFLRLLMTEFSKAVANQDGTRKTPRDPLPIQESFDYLFVDEAQDNAAIDWQIYDALPIANKFFVGDPDQAIYSFRGGRVDLLMRYAARAAVEVIKLEANFRSHMEICVAANALIENNTGRIDKMTRSVNGFGGRVEVIPQRLNEGDEIAEVTRKILYDCTAPVDAREWNDRDPRLLEIAILARNNDLCRAFREALKASGVPVVEAPKSTLPADWQLAKAMIEHLAQPDNDTVYFFYLIAARMVKFSESPEQARAFAHTLRLAAARAGVSIFKHMNAVESRVSIVNYFHLTHGYLSDESSMKIKEIVATLPPESTLLDLALAMNAPPKDEAPEGQGVTVTTLHGAKGREFDTVFLVGMEDEIIPGNRKTDTAADVEEARRLFYVGVTRARKALFISSAKQRKTSWGSIVFHNVSRFVKEISA